MPNLHTHDVIIAGGGLAGLTLSIQLKQKNPDLDIVVLERNRFPFPDSTAKVGESTVEIGSHYFNERLGLRDHFKEKHLLKQGLRFFMGEPQDDFSKLDEVGVSELFGIPTYQIDRGVLENHLHSVTTGLGVTVLDGVTTKNPRLDNLKQQIDVYTGDDEYKTLQAPWLVDAAGRQMLIKNKLGLAKDNDHNSNAIWFRIDRKIIIDDWSDDQDWHDRMVEPRRRWLSTNHLMGPGYWVWVIPLGTGATSIGIVMDDQVFEESNLTNYEKAYAWLETNQPQCAEAISGAKVLDFVSLTDYSYDCKKVFSDDGWALSGESGLFADPFYSPGSDFIALGNTFIGELINLRTQKKDIQLESTVFNNLHKSIYDNTLSLYTHQYAGFGDRVLVGTKLFWDYSYYWGILSLLYFKNTLIDIDLMRELNPILLKSRKLNQQVQAKMRERAANRAILPAKGVFMDQYQIPCLHHFNTILKSHKTVDVRDALIKNTEMLERLAVYSLDLLSDNPTRTISDDERDLLGDYRNLLLA